LDIFIDLFLFNCQSIFNFQLFQTDQIDKWRNYIFEKFKPNHALEKLEKFFSTAPSFSWGL